LGNCASGLENESALHVDAFRLPKVQPLFGLAARPLDSRIRIGRRATDRHNTVTIRCRRVNLGNCRRDFFGSSD
jgi:hypothetical protein